MTVSPDAAEQARLLFAQNCDFVLSAAEAAHFPPSALPEVAFIGRSNVGKSSLVNALTGRTKLARASNTPGRTQQIVFFNLAKRLMLADLPGYGFAQAPLAEKERWNQLTQQYFNQRRVLKCVCLLIDARHGAKANDTEMMDVLDRAAVPYYAVLTKTDQIKPAELADRLQQVKGVLARHPAARDGILATSSESKNGIDDLRALLAGLALKE